MAHFTGVILSFISYLLFLILHTPLSHAKPLSYNRAACQSSTPNPLTGCPANTLLVSSNTTTSNTTFTSIQSAILSLPADNSSATILILPGTYTEQLNITRPGPVTLLGQTSNPNNASANGVTVLWREATGNDENSFDNAYTAVLTVAPTWESSLTGTGPTGYPVPEDTPFGNGGFAAYNVDFVNDYKDVAAGPALALSVSYANAGFYYCGFYSYQDTVYVGKLGNAYFDNSIIAGQTDFLYGFGTAWIQSSLLSLRNCGGGITAWKGTNTTFENKYGVYIHDSEVRKANDSLSIEGECSLGRPWNAQHRSIFANTYLDASIRPSGYTTWGSTDPRTNNYTLEAEYQNFGPGFNRTGRLAENISRLLSDEEYAPYSSLDEVFQFPFSDRDGNTAWIDRSPEA
ncbi:carbohydrate esterase family 8 protein [Aplosporella prunicola CBS 121167]|uniref:pectinesterase n=1 Tax=Aplosporella prunicola CBS 121167 TaxID=1176127 RepID=A0A6A6AWI0_9PEZI|nr:carbohydrate esterase family 8 protein [Aplosporella prunicola CBS 121167]KAF2135335.1 carbohydrate esterase family 8 protein [Aplosporella prunicola CBS 121167]